MKTQVRFLSLAFTFLFLLFPNFTPGFETGHILAGPVRCQQVTTGYVRVINQTNRAVRLYGTDYIDGSNDRYNLSGYWTIQPGANTYLLDNDQKIQACKFGFWLSDNYGQTPWKIDTENNYSDGNLTLYINNQLLARHLEIRQKAMGTALLQLGGALVAQHVVTAGDPRNDTLGDLLARGIALGMRQSLIEGAVNSVFPHFDSGQKAAARRVVGLVLEGRLNFKNYDEASRRDALLATIRRDQPNLAGAADFLDFMDGLSQVYNKQR